MICSPRNRRNFMMRKSIVRIAGNRCNFMERKSIVRYVCNHCNFVPSFNSNNLKIVDSGFANTW